MLYRWNTIGTQFHSSEITKFNEFVNFIGLTSTGNYNAFYGANNLAEITLPPNLVTITGTSFRGIAISEIIIPAKVTSIGVRSFAFCSKLTTITMLPTTPPTIDSTTFQSSNKIAHIFVPAESVTAYQTAANWSSYASLITAIPQ